MQKVYKHENLSKMMYKPERKLLNSGLHNLHKTRHFINVHS